MVSVQIMYAAHCAATVQKSTRWMNISRFGILDVLIRLMSIKDTFQCTDIVTIFILI